MCHWETYFALWKGWKALSTFSKVLPYYFDFIFVAEVVTEAEPGGLRTQWPPTLLVPCSADLEH